MPFPDISAEWGLTPYESLHNDYVRDVLEKANLINMDSKLNKETAFIIIDAILVLGYELDESRMDLYKKAIKFFMPDAKLDNATNPTIRQLAYSITDRFNSTSKKKRAIKINQE
jgi:hypothetical protein